MSTAACDKFIRNGWKKELCSNCFKAKQEHVETALGFVLVKPLLLRDPPKEGILRDRNLPLREKKNVAFSTSESQVIGFGGEAEFSDDEDDEGYGKRSGVVLEEEPDTEKDRVLERLTKNNTEYNSVPNNLLGLSTPVLPIGLGKKVLDKDGTKKTLLVSVSPFTSIEPKLIHDIDKKSHLPDHLAGSRSLYESGSLPKAIDVGIKRSQPLDKNFKYKLNKDAPEERFAVDNMDPNEKLQEKIRTVTKVSNLLDKAKKKVPTLPVIGDLQQLKLKNVETKLNEANKGVALDIFTIKDIKEKISVEKSAEESLPISLEELKVDEVNSNECSLPSKDFSTADKTVDIADKIEALDDLKELNEAVKKRKKKWDNYEGVLGGEEVTVFSAESVEDRVEECFERLERPPVAAEMNLTTDVDCTKSPPLPTSPPPSVHPRMSFLHHLTNGSLSRASAKPKLPAKPTIIPARKPAVIVSRPKSPSNESFLDDARTSPGDSKLVDPITDPAKKRPAPQPPQSVDILSVYPPLPRSARSAENLLKLSRSGFSTTLHLRSNISQVLSQRSYSLSEDCLLDCGISEDQIRKKNSRGRFSLRKLLHLGKSKEVVKESERMEHKIVNSLRSYPVDSSRLNKPEIIHPAELTQLRLQQDGSSPTAEQLTGLDHSCESSITQSTFSEKSTASPVEMRSCITPRKPARTGSLLESSACKITEPFIDDDENAKRENRTGTLRGAGKCSNQLYNQPEDSGYESFDVSLPAMSESHSSSNTSPTNDENLYECVMQLETRWTDSNTMPKQSHTYCCSDKDLRCESENGHAGFLGSTPMAHCNAAADSDSIYIPYSFCSSELGEDDYEWSTVSGRFQRVSRLKMKKGRSIVHKNLEDNYGAVVIANHEALTQVVQQIHQGPIVPVALRSLVTATNLRWRDFTVLKDHGSVSAGQRTLYPALWGLEPVTVCLAPEESVGCLHGKPPFSLQPLTQLHDLVPAKLVSPGNLQDSSLVQCSISVINRMQVESLQSYCRTVSGLPVSEDAQKEIYFLLLLIINALKTQQASGIEEVPVGLTNVLVCREERDPHAWICLLPEHTEPTISLCASLMEFLNCLPPMELTKLLETILRAEKAGSLSQAKALLEFTLWGPADISFEKKSRGAALQRWLDLERASVLHGLVRTRSDLSVFDEWHLLFLAHTNAKILNDAADLLGI